MDSLKNLNPEGPSGIYLCDVTFPTLLITCSVSFLWNKENKQDFLQDEKNLIYLSLSPEYILFPVFLFPLSFFSQMLCFLSICIPRHMIVAGYYNFTLDVRVSVHPSTIVRTSFHLFFISG